MNVWGLNAKHVEDLQGSDGGAFRDFVNRIIFAYASSCGIPSSTISTDSRNVSDGGVDSQVNQAASNDVRNRFRHKTCWQFKATSHSNISDSELEAEVSKDYCTNLIQQGYAYRFCIADTLTAVKKSHWEAILNAKIRQINQNAPDAQVLTSTCLAEWANQFPAIILSRIPADRFAHLETWGRAIVLPTQKYVPVPGWKAITDQITLHADICRKADSLILPIHADAGIGKTRLVYETLAAIPSSKALVIYTSDEEDAQNLAHYCNISVCQLRPLRVPRATPEQYFFNRVPGADHWLVSIIDRHTDNSCQFVKFASKNYFQKSSLKRDGPVFF